MALFAWLAASNHCAVASLHSVPVAATGEHEHCPGHEAPAKKDLPKGGCDGQNCCKSLFAPVTALAKNLLGHDTAFFVTKHYPAADAVLLREQHDAPISELDTGPPYRRTFAELVLQHSVRAHAPPSFV
jgi:hypothetical protein